MKYIYNFPRLLFFTLVSTSLVIGLADPVFPDKINRLERMLPIAQQLLYPINRPDSKLDNNGMLILFDVDNPVIGSVNSSVTLYGTPSATLWAEDVTTTGTIDKVWAMITPPEYLNEEPVQPVTNLPTVELVDNGSGHYEGTYSDFSTYGTYTVAVYAMDTDGNISLPKDTYVEQRIGPDLYEDDDTSQNANVIIHDYEEAQRHTFHDEGDEDWVKFYGLAGETYEIKTENLESKCDTTIDLYDESGVTVVSTRDQGWYGEGELLSWQCPADGIYYVLVKQYDGSDYGQDTAYDLRVYHPTAGLPGWLMGMVVSALGDGIGGAVIRSDVSNTTTMSLDSGFYLMILPSGTHEIGVEASGYEPQSTDGVVVQAEKHTNQDFVMYSPGMNVEIDLNTGWNLISLDNQPLDTRIAAVLSSISGKYVSVWAYSNGSWRVYDPNNPGFSDLTTMEAGSGYWINMTESATLTLSGSTPSNSIELVSSWNLVGYNSSTSQAVADALASIASQYVSVWAYINGSWKVYDPNNPGFSDLTAMESSYGYWINATETCTLTLP